MTVPLARLNAMTAEQFTAALGAVFEHSPWVAARAFPAGPFADVAALHRAMVEAVERAPRSEQLALLRAHPELAGREARAGTLTADSTGEQKSAGLDALSRPEIDRIAELNRRYRERFGFPFIIAVRRHDKAGIFREFERRLALDAETEVANALAQVYAITRLRLNALVAT